MHSSNSIMFNDCDEVDNHPQAKRLGISVIRHIFDGALSQREIDMLDKGVTDLSKDIEEQLTLEEKKRLLICAIHSSKAPKSMSDLFNHAKDIEGMSTQLLAKIFLLSNDEESIRRCCDRLTQEKLSLSVLNDLLTYFDNFVCRGWLTQLKYLLNHPLTKDFYSKHPFNIIDYSHLIVNAAFYGHLETVKYLVMQQPKEDRVKSIAGEGFHSIRVASQNGHLAVLEYLLAELPINGRINALEYNGYHVIALAINNNCLAVFEYLMQYGQAFSYMEAGFFNYYMGKRKTYQLYLTNYISKQLRQLEKARLDFEVSKADGVFDISLEDVSKYFIILCHLVRKNLIEDVDNIKKLTALPAMDNVLRNGFTKSNVLFFSLESHKRALSNSNVSDLFETAWQCDNRSVMKILLQNPLVRDVIERNRKSDEALYYDSNPDTVTGARCIKLGAKKRLTAAQTDTMLILKYHYQASLENEGGTHGVFNHLLATLQARYEQNPVKMFIQDKAHYLPLTQDDFLSFKWKHRLTDELYSKGLKLCDKDKNHLLFRYLSRLSHLLKKEARYGESYGIKTQSWSVLEKHMTQICLFYLATKDDSMAWCDGSSMAERLSHFLGELDIIRGGQFLYSNISSDDNLPIKVATNITKYDEQLNTLLYGSVLNHPFIGGRDEAINKEIKYFVRKHAITILEKLSAIELAQLNSDVNKVFNEAEVDGAKLPSITAFNISKESQQQFLEHLIQHVDDDQQASIPALITKRFALTETFSTHLARFYADINFSDLYASFISASSRVRFFSPQATISHCDRQTNSQQGLRGAEETSNQANFLTHRPAH